MIYENKLKKICYNFSDMKDKFLFIMLNYVFELIFSKE
jgi:hypothetical protein